MLHNILKNCQYCLEDMYWYCCEERFCFDEKIATFQFEDAPHPNGHANMGASLDSVVTEQPSHNNNHLPPHAISGRMLTEMPVNADKIVEVFSKSLIFRRDHELKTSSTDSLDEIETKSEPDYLSDTPNRTKVYFEDEINSPITDFEIMFTDELTGVKVNEDFKGLFSEDHSPHAMFKIEEENEEQEGLTMSVIKKQDVLKPTSITIKEQNKITTHTPIFEYDPSTSAVLPSTITLPQNSSVKSILRRDISRSNSAKNLNREDSHLKLSLKSLSRVESLKNIDAAQVNRVLARVPLRSASFLNLPEHLLPDNKPKLRKSDSAFAIGAKSSSIEMVQISKLPDTPMIKSANLPKFFDRTPTLGEYKGQTSLQSIKVKAEQSGEDFSMPRYYGKIATVVEPPPMHESKSMPDLRAPGQAKVSKRLVNIRSKLKPLLIKKGTEERL